MKPKILFFTAALWLLLAPSKNFGQAPDLGTASTFALFTAEGAFNNLGVTMVVGDIGTNVGAFSGYPPGVVIGQIHVADAVSATAAADVAIAYADLAGRTCGAVIGTTLGNGQVLLPNIYCTGAASTLNGNLVLDGQGDPGAIFIFQIDGALSTSTFASITLVNSASLCNVYWQINGALFLGDFSVFYGIILANGAISLANGSTLYGQGLSTAGAIETSANVISLNGCGSGMLPTVTCPAAATFSCTAPPPDINSVGVVASCGPTPAVIFLDDVISNQACTNQYLLTRRYQATNACGEVAVCAQLITINDQTQPTISGCAPNITVTCPSGVPLPSPSGVTASDNCSGAVTVTFSGDIISGQICPDQYTITRTYSAADACGNTATCSQIITVSDLSAPTVACPATATVTCASLVPAANPAGVITSDNCGGAATVTFLGDVTTLGICANQYTIARSYSATDACGNTATCSQTITVSDLSAPTVACPATATVTCASLVPAANPAGVITSDNCGGAATVIFLGDVTTPGICANRYTIARSYSATDACGNSATCSQTITVSDLSAPTVACPATATVTCASLVPAANPASVITSDNCGGAATIIFLGDVTTPGICPNQYTIARTYRVADACGNSATCSQTITVSDLSAPIVSCPATATVTCASLVPAANPAGVITSDNCGGAVTVTFVSDVISNQTCAGQYTITRTYRATDNCGNMAACAQVVTVFDNVAPVFMNPPVNITIECTTAPPVVPPTATDNCSAITVTFLGETQVPGVCPVLYTITRSWIAADACGNVSPLLSQVITVTDSNAPVFANSSSNAALNIVLECDLNNNPDAYQNWLDIQGGAVVTDCSAVTWTSATAPVITHPVECGNTFQQFIRFTATDICGNSSYVDGSFTIMDITPPVFDVMPQNLVVDCSQPTDASGETEMWVWMNHFGYAEVSDNCGSVVTHMVVLSEIQGCGLTHTTTFQFQATDECGNTNFVTATFTILDTAPPVIDTCPQGNLLLTCVNDIPAPDLAGIIAHDDCGPVTISVQSISAGSGCAKWPLTTEYTYTVTDACGNQSFCFQYFQAVDTVSILYAGPDTIFVACVNDLPGSSEIIGLLTPLAYDNCTGFVCLGIVSVTADSNSVTYTMMAKDVCSNMTDPFVVTYIATGICKPICSAPQSIWGDESGLMNGVSTTMVINQFLAEHGGVTVGRGGKTISITSTDCVQSMLPGYGTVTQFRQGKSLFSLENDCQPSSPLLNPDGTLKNILAANVIALQFNIWYNQAFNDRNLGIQQLTQLPGCLMNPAVLEKMGTDFPTVQGLLNLADDYLAGVGFFPPKFGIMLNEALENMNTYWQNCQINSPCVSRMRNDSYTDDLLSKITLAPNPATDVVIITLETATDADLQVRFLGSTGVQSEMFVPVVIGVNQLRFSTKSFPAGVYTVVLQQGNDRQILRLVKVLE
jgi:hypothetical protein